MRFGLSWGAAARIGRSSDASDAARHPRWRRFRSHDRRSRDSDRSAGPSERVRRRRSRSRRRGAGCARTLLSFAFVGVSANASADSTPPPSIQPVSSGAPTVHERTDESACVGCSLDPGVLLAAYSGEQWTRLRDGEILLDDGSAEAIVGSGSRTTFAAAWIEQPPRQVWAVLTDFERWPSFVPLVTETEITRRDGARAWVHQKYRVVFRNMSHTTVYDLAPRFGRLTWRLDADVPHDIASSEGNWQLVPMEDGRSTLLRYRAAMDAGRAIPDFVEDMLARRSLRTLFVQLREEVERASEDTDSP